MSKLQTQKLPTGEWSLDQQVALNEQDRENKIACRKLAGKRFSLQLDQMQQSKAAQSNFSNRLARQLKLRNSEVGNCKLEILQKNPKIHRPLIRGSLVCTWSKNDQTLQKLPEKDSFLFTFFSKTFLGFALCMILAPSSPVQTKKRFVDRMFKCDSDECTLCTQFFRSFLKKLSLLFCMSF